MQVDGHEAPSEVRVRDEFAEPPIAAAADASASPAPRRGRPGRVAAFTGLLVIVVAVATMTGYALHLNAGQPTHGGVATASPAGTAPSGAQPSAVASGAAGASPAVPPARAFVYLAPTLPEGLPDLDPDLATRGPRPTLAQLAGFQLGLPSVMFKAHAGPTDWRLAKPSFSR
jgi:hypothetical protein